MNKNLTWAANKKNDVITKIKFTTAKLYAKVETATQHYLDYIAGHNAYDSCDLTEIENLKNDITRAIKIMSDYCQPETYRPLHKLGEISPYLDILEEQGLKTEILDDLFENNELTLGNIERYLIAQTEELERTLACYDLPENIKSLIKTELEIKYGLLDQLAKWNTTNNTDDDDSGDFGSNFQKEYYYDNESNDKDDIDKIIDDIPSAIRPADYSLELMYSDERML